VVAVWELHFEAISASACPSASPWPGLFEPFRPTAVRSPGRKEAREELVGSLVGLEALVDGQMGVESFQVEGGFLQVVEEDRLVVVEDRLGVVGVSPLLEAETYSFLEVGEELPCQAEVVAEEFRHWEAEEGQTSRLPAGGC
jgi:hypothetical protein